MHVQCDIQAREWAHADVADWRAGRSESIKRKRMKTDAYVHIGTTEEYAGGMSDKDRRELECEKVRCFFAAGAGWNCQDCETSHSCLLESRCLLGMPDCVRRPDGHVGVGSMLMLMMPSSSPLPWLVPR